MHCIMLRIIKALSQCSSIIVVAYHIFCEIYLMHINELSSIGV